MEEERGLDMDGFTVPTAIDLIIDLIKKAFPGITGKIKLYLVKRKLKQKIFDEILKKYGDKVFYNDLDHFLTDNDVICNIIRNCHDTPVFQYKSKSQMIAYYVKLFVERQPKYSRYQYEIKSIIQKYFDVIYLTLNKYKNDDTRVVCNIAKELANELTCELQDIKKALDHLDKKIDRIITGSDNTQEKIYIDDYRKHLLFLYSSFYTVDYLERKIYSNEESDIKSDALDALLKEKNILVLGEAGFGKTYEAIKLLREACADERSSELIPILLHLEEYGLIYLDIVSGIKYNLASFCEGNVEKLIENQLKNGKFLLIFDGIDDITQDIYRKKFYAEFKHFSIQYSSNFFFVTSRFNRYHGELGEKRQYYLTEINEHSVRQELRKEGISVSIPRHYYKLFSNPLFLTIGKSILKQSKNQEIFNRSKLFEELFQKLYGGISQQGGQTENTPLTYSDAINILGCFAYHTFYQSSYSYMEFDQQISKIVNENKINIVNSFVCSGLFKIEDKVYFIHKLLKEYCVAYYLVHNVPLYENLEMYLNLVEKDEWKEVFIFAGGIFNNSQLQDSFLDFIMEHNLPLYVECLNAKSDISETDDSNNSKRLLTQIFRTYRYIINKYFTPIEGLFEPHYLNDYFEAEQNKKIGIIGCLSENKKHLSYWFAFVPNDEDDVQCLSEQELKNSYAGFEKNSILHKGNFTCHGVNLQLSGLSEDSGRKIAIDLIKHRLKELIEDRNLFESKYLLCERVAGYQKKIKELRNLDNLVEMQAIIDDMIDKALQSAPNMMEYIYDGIELFTLRDLLHYLNQDYTAFTEYILPGEDMPLPSSGSCFIWELYSKEQKEHRLEKFFYFHEISYLYMVENNFPNLKKYFPRYNDAPYQVVVEINHKEDIDSNDYTTEPSMQYYYIASPTVDIPMPIIRRVNEESFSDFNMVIQKIQDSFSKQGRNVNHMSATRSCFTTITTSTRTKINAPLADYVYRSIKESLEDALGSIG